MKPDQRKELLSHANYLMSHKHEGIILDPHIKEFLIKILGLERSNAFDDPNSSIGKFFAFLEQYPQFLKIGISYLQVLNIDL